MADVSSHTAAVLEIVKSEPTTQRAHNTTNGKRSDDEEAKGTSSYPGATMFADALRQRARAQTSKKGFLLETWKKSKNFEAKANSELIPEHQDEGRLTQRDEQRLLLVFYLQCLLYASFDALISVVNFAEDLAAAGKLKQNRLILPGRRRLQRMFRTMFSEDHPGHSHDSEEEVNPSSSLEAVGDSFSKRRDPEHSRQITRRRWSAIGYALLDIFSDLPRAHSEAERPPPYYPLPL
jgi:hypothetical protein